jgi:hypothetical protein
MMVPLRLVLVAANRMVKPKIIRCGDDVLWGRR